MKPDPRVDAYIAARAEFARPILEHLRAAVHAACPEAEETIKWGMPHFLYQGQILAGMAAFKAHATFGFWRAKEVVGETGAERQAMGQFGRITKMEDLPEPAVLGELIRRAMALGDAGSKPVRGKSAKPPVEVPADLRCALDACPAAAATFDGFPESCRREYADWVGSAKREETRAKRVVQAVEWMAQGKRRNWKYENC